MDREIDSLVRCNSSRSCVNDGSDMASCIDYSMYGEGGTSRVYTRRPRVYALSPELFSADSLLSATNRVRFELLAEQLLMYLAAGNWRVDLGSGGWESPGAWG